MIVPMNVVLALCTYGILMCLAVIVVTTLIEAVMKHVLRRW